MDQLDQQRAKSAALEKDLATARQELESCSVQADQLYAKGETLLQQLRDQQAQAEALRAQFQDNEAQLRQQYCEQAVFRQQRDCEAFCHSKTDN